MDLLSKLNEIEAFANLMKDNVDVLKKEIVKQGKSKKKVESRTSDLVARVKAKRARSRLP